MRVYRRSLRADSKGLSNEANLKFIKALVEEKNIKNPKSRISGIFLYTKAGSLHWGPSKNAGPNMINVYVLEGFGLIKSFAVLKTGKVVVAAWKNPKTQQKLVLCTTKEGLFALSRVLFHIHSNM